MNPLDNIAYASKMEVEYSIKTKREATMIKNNIAQLLETEMERKDFLKLIGFGVVAATGITQILKAMSQPTSSRQVAAPRAQSYGGATYGGIAKK